MDEGQHRTNIEHNLPVVSAIITIKHTLKIFVKFIISICDFYIPKRLSKIGYKKVHNEIPMSDFSTQMTWISQDLDPANSFQ